MNQLREREAAKLREAEAREREAELARQQLEKERLAREEEERRQAEREKVLEKKKGVGRGVSRTVESSSSGVRGVRGTRASIRARGVATGIVRGAIAFSFNSPRCSAHFIRSQVRDFWSWTDEYSSTFVLRINPAEFCPSARSWTRLMHWIIRVRRVF